MAIGTTTLTQIPPAIATFYDGVLLDRMLPYLVHAKYGQKRPVDQKSGNTAKFRRYGSLPASTTPLIEGSSPSPLQVSITDYTETLLQYGAYVEYTDIVEYFNEDPVLTEFAELLGEHAGDSLDQVFRDKLNAGSSVYRGGAVAARNLIVTKVTEDELHVIRRTLARANAKPFKPVVKASTGVGTSPLRPAFIALIHPDVSHDVMKLTNFKPVAQYASLVDVEEGEIGSDGYFRFIETTNAKYWASAGGSSGSAMKTTDGTNWDVYSIVILAENAYGITDLQGAAMQTIVKSKEQEGGPLNQKGTMGWKGITGLCILNDLLMLRYEVCVSA